MKKSIMMITIMIWIFLSVSNIRAEDNADSGSNGSQKAVAGFYRSKDWMYKVSIYIGKSDNSNVNGSINDFYLVGQPIFTAPSTLNIIPSYTVYTSPYNKMQYLQGGKIKVELLNQAKILYKSGVPSIPIINGGSIVAVKQYFGDTNTLTTLLDEIAKVQGTTKEALLTAKSYTINGVTQSLSIDEILPVKSNSGKLKNKVPYLIVYEPIAIGYLTDGKTALAFTATEYAITQKKGLMNFFTKSLGKVSTAPQLMWGLTHRDLPNSIFLEESWLGLPARAEVANRKSTKQWTKALIDSVSDTIIKGSGIGMRFLKPLGTGIINNPKTAKTSGLYRTDTEVITSIKVEVPSTTNRIDKFNPDNPGYVNFTINGVTKSHKVIIPDGGSQLAWIKWKTPSQPGIVTIDITMSEGMVTEDGKATHTINAEIVELQESTPPDPEATDVAKDFNYKDVPIPTEPEMKENTWGEYFAKWQAHWVDKGDWEKNPDGTFVLPKKWKPDFKDEGWWSWEYKTYYAKLSSKVTIEPSDETPTKTKHGTQYEIKSGYGIKIKAEAIITTDAPSSDHYTNAGTAISYFPEFQYKKYWRVLQSNSANSFGFQKNPYSQWEAPVHFTPIWFPDKEYQVYTEIQDVWTPAGMLKVNGNNSIKIKGNVYDDWHIGPTKPE